MPAGTMRTATAYCLGDTYTLQPVDGAKPVTIALAAGVRIGPSGLGRPLVFGPEATYGTTLDCAVPLGWCTVVEDAAPSGRDAEPVRP